MPITPSALALGLVCALAAVPTAASDTPQTKDGAVLLVNYFTGGAAGKRHPTLISVSSDAPIAKVQLSVPAGYPLKLDQPPGTRLGRVDAFVSDVAGGARGQVAGDLVADDPARYLSDPAAQACAPGSHTAVWVASLSGRGQTLRLPIFVDREGGPGGSGAVLRFCPIWPTPVGSVTLVMLNVEGIFGVLTARGRNTWSALVSPPLPTLAPDESRTFELRALEPMPHVVTLRARHYPERRIVVLSGRVTAAGEPVKGAKVAFGVIRKSLPAGGAVPFVGPAKTNASGAFSFRHRIRETTRYFTDVLIPPRPCSGPSTAPGGCLRETVSRPQFAVTTVRVRAHG
jgi:hypothetical protein